MSDKKVSFLVITMDRFEDLQECVDSILNQKYENIELVILDNGSKLEEWNRFKQKYQDDGRFRLIRSEQNLGVAGGRNRAMGEATGDILISIDDDAIICDENLTSRVVEQLGKDKKVGALAFRIINYFTKEVRRSEFPTKDKDRSDEERFEVGRFIGAGHAIKSTVIEDVGGYRNYFPYGHEEIDLSIRIIENGYKIMYEPSCEIFHKQTPESRVFTQRTIFLANMLEKRIRVSIHNLPWRYVFTTAFIRTGQFLIDKSNFNVISIIYAYLLILKNFSDIIEDRCVVSDETIKKLWNINGPLLY